MQRIEILMFDRFDELDVVAPLEMLASAGFGVPLHPRGPLENPRRARDPTAVPFGKCSNPQNVAAEGYGCPIRHRCFGCASFSSDPSYLPEMRR